jgi:predicted DNA-binding protein (MmcQ/YjbR family)
VAKSINEAVREVCLSFAEAEEIVSHGSPNFRVRGKTFASYVVNHHGDGRVALWLNAPAGSQDHYTKSEPRHFFVPPYVGPRGWLGVHLDKGLPWQRVAALVRQAYEKVAPRGLADSIGETLKIKSPPAALAADEVNPLKSRQALAILKRLRQMYLSWPEVSEDVQFGSPVWRAGKKTFAWLHADRPAQPSAPGGSDTPGTRGKPGASGSPGTRRPGKRQARPRLKLYFWVGVAAQGLMTPDERFEIPAYMGHNGWIALDVTEHCDWKEVRGLALASYRHFALHRMLKALDMQAPA